jgi:O-antigen/teichoic acid export membrane protein
LNLINVGTQMLFPLLTFPYVCRILLPAQIGQVNFYNSIIGYISLFTCLGIPMYAVREVARERDDIVQMNRTTIEVLLLHTLLTLIGYVAVVILCLTVPQIKENIPLFLILSITLIFTVIGCDWFYNGIEDFKYITIRGIVVKSISVILLFLLVKSKEDLLWYGVYCVVGSIGGNVFNFIRLRKYIHKENIIFAQLHIFRHLKPAIKVFSFNVVISVYLQLNPVLLGFMKDTIAVAYFTAATKLMMMVTKISSSLGTVLMPRASHLISEGKKDEFNKLIQKSYDFTLALTIPLVIGLICMAPYIVRVFCGSQYEDAIITSQIIAPITLVVGLSNIMGMQVLYPIGKINTVVKCTIYGAITNVILNLALIPFLSFNGTAIAYLGAEVATTLSMYIIAKQDMPIKFFKKDNLTYFVGGLLMILSIFAVAALLKANNLIMLIAETLIGFGIYSLYLIYKKDQFANLVITKIKTLI